MGADSFEGSEATLTPEASSSEASSDQECPAGGVRAMPYLAELGELSSWSADDAVKVPGQVNMLKQVFLHPATPDVPSVKSVTCPPPARAMRARTLQDAWCNFKINQQD